MQTLSLSKRPIDIAFIILFCINFPFITYAVDPSTGMAAAPMMRTNVVIILFEEINGEHASPKLARVLASKENL